MSLKPSYSKHDYLNSFENRLKELWSQYVECLNTDPTSEKAKSLREQYFRLYKGYRNDMYWKKILMDN